MLLTSRYGHTATCRFTSIRSFRAVCGPVGRFERAFHVVVRLHVL